MHTVTLTFAVTINATAHQIFEYLTDWEQQADWISFTTVQKLSSGPNAVGTEVLAVTALGPLRLVDTMVLTKFMPPLLMSVEHTGRVILGKGVFSVQENSSDTCVFTWQEITPVPFGLAGRAALFVVRPVLKLLFNGSLEKLKQNIEASR